MIQAYLFSRSTSSAMADKIKADALAGAAKGLKHAETKEKNPLPTKAFVFQHSCLIAPVCP